MSAHRVDRLVRPLGLMAAASVLMAGCVFNLDGDRAGFELVNRLDVAVDVI